MMFPRHVENGILDLDALNVQIEQIEAEIGLLTARRDQLQQMAYRRLHLLRVDTQSHEAEIGEGTALCRTGERCDPSAKELRAMCHGCVTTGKGPKAA